MKDLRVILVSRELSPLGGAGIGAYVRSTAEALAPIADVTIITTDVFESRYHELAARRDPRLPPAKMVFVREPVLEELYGYYNIEHCWSGRVYEALLREAREQPPDVVEFPDFLGEGFVTVQARATDQPALRHTAVCLRLYTTAQMTAILDGFVSQKFLDQVTFELERYALAHCDHLIWPGGDVLGTYERIYGRKGLGAPVKVRHPLFISAEIEHAIARAFQPADRLRMLYLGRLERRKGVHNLLQAVGSVDVPDWTLTLVGADTLTAPLGQSMEAMLRRLAGEDPRISFQDAVPREEVPGLAAAHDLVVLPSLWECWPAVGAESLAGGVPLLATPVGGLTEMAQAGRSGWQSRGTGSDDLAEVIESLADQPDQVGELRDSGAPRATFEELTDPDQVRERYTQIAAEARNRRRNPKAPHKRLPPLVSVIIPYFQLESFIEEAVASVVEQAYPNLEVIVVNDGSFRPVDGILAELEQQYSISVLTQLNSGLGAARNAGIRQCSGEYVVPLDADDVLEPSFVERCVEVLEAEPDVVYVTSWLRYTDEAGDLGWGGENVYRPLGNFSYLLSEQNVASSATAVLRRRIFDQGYRYSESLTSYEDWTLYRELREAGLEGRVIPEPLIRYRVRAGSMARMLGSPNLGRQQGEIVARLREKATSWTPSSG